MSLLTPNIGLIFWMTLTFIIVLLILGKWGWPVVIKGLKKRENDIKNSLEAAQNAKKEMEKLKADNSLLLAQASKERDEILKQARETSSEMIAQAKVQARQESEKIVLQAKADIETQKNKALNDLKQQVGLLSLDIAEKVLQKQVSSKQESMQIIEEQMAKLNLNQNG